VKPDAASIDAYESRVDVLSAFGPVIEGMVTELVAAAGIRAHSVVHRIKSKTSFRRKLSEKGEAYGTIDDMHDLLGVRVITYFPDEVDAVARIVEREFDVDIRNSVDKRALLDPDRFGYLSLHYVCALNEARSALTEHKRFGDLHFEVQIRSILQHAWAEIEHDRGYHTEGVVPRGVRRRFSQLAGLLELADAQFRQIRDELDEYRKGLAKDTSDADIDRDSVAAFVYADPVVAQLDLHLSEKHADGLEGVTDSWGSNLVTKLHLVGLTTIADLERTLHERADVVRRFADEWLRDSSIEGAFYRGITLFYLWYVLVAERMDEDEIFAVVRDQKFGPDPPEVIARKVRETYNAVTSKR
jgi:putative GTP pyrophosphokinase